VILAVLVGTANYISQLLYDHFHPDELVELMKKQGGV
jgi:hypothetical protein